MKFENTQGITEIRMNKNVRAFCPMGNDWYCGRVDIILTPGEYIPDYVEVDQFFSTLDGKQLILEEVVNEVFNYFVKEYSPYGLEVSCYSNDAVHLPVTVTKKA